MQDTTNACSSLKAAPLFFSFANIILCSPGAHYARFYRKLPMFRIVHYNVASMLLSSMTIRAPQYSGGTAASRLPEFPTPVYPQPDLQQAIDEFTWRIAVASAVQCRYAPGIGLVAKFTCSFLPGLGKDGGARAGRPLLLPYTSTEISNQPLQLWI